jgi:hypothetical protein
MALKMFTTFNSTDVTFSDVYKNAKGGKAVYLKSALDGQKLMFQLPPLRAPFGLSQFKDEASGRISYTMPLSLDKPEILEAFAKLDARILDHLTAHSEEILGKKMSREVISEGMYKSCIKPSSKEGYAPTLNLKVITDPKTGNLVTSAWSAQKESVPLDSLEKGQSVNAIIELNQIWRTPAGVGVSVRVHQVMFAPTNKLKPCAFLSTETTEETAEFETDSDVSVDEN